MSSIPPLKTQEQEVPKWSITIDEIISLTGQGVVTYYTAKEARVPMVRYTMFFEAVDFNRQQASARAVRLFGDVQVTPMHPKAQAILGDGENIRIAAEQFAEDPKRAKILQKGEKLVRKRLAMGVLPEVVEGKSIYTTSEVTKGWRLSGMGRANILALLVSLGTVANILYSIYNKATKGKFEGISTRFAAAGMPENEAALAEMGTVSLVDLALIGGALKLGLIGTAAAAGAVATGSVGALAIPVGGALYVLHDQADTERREAIEYIRSGGQDPKFGLRENPNQSKMKKWVLTPPAVRSSNPLS